MTTLEHYNSTWQTNENDTGQDDAVDVCEIIAEDPFGLGVINGGRTHPAADGNSDALRNYSPGKARLASRTKTRASSVISAAGPSSGRARFRSH